MLYIYTIIYTIIPLLTTPNSMFKVKFPWVKKYCCSCMEMVRKYHCRSKKHYWNSPKKRKFCDLFSRTDPKRADFGNRILDTNHLHIHTTDYRTYIVANSLTYFTDMFSFLKPHFLPFKKKVLWTWWLS